MNYIKHLNAFFSLVRNDKRLSATHVSLYLALFYYWNFNRFQNPFTIYRENLMQLSKIGSKTTYHRCIKQLHQAQYIYYHPRCSKFQTVRISIVGLWTDEETESRYKQQLLFPNVPSPEEHLDGSPSCPKSGTDQVPKAVPPSTKNGTSPETPCPKNGTDTVPKMVRPSPENGTDTVPKVGHSINKTFYKLNSVCNTPTNFLEEDGEQPSADGNPPGRRVNELPRVPKSRHGDPALPRRDSRESVEEPPMTEVETFFLQNNSTTEEAYKFYYYNQGKNWMLTDKLPIANWKAVAQKWLLNTTPQNKPPMDPKTVIQTIYELYLQGEKINKLLLPEFADHLQLQISESVKIEAINRRINQLSGSNENADIKLWRAYMEQDFTSALLIDDEPNLLALAKRLVVTKHFQKLKARKQQNVFSTTDERTT